MPIADNGQPKRFTELTHRLMLARLITAKEPFLGKGRWRRLPHSNCTLSTVYRPVSRAGVLELKQNKGASTFSPDRIAKCLDQNARSDTQGILPYGKRTTIKTPCSFTSTSLVP
jgi:hypothetical protein